MPTEKKSDSLRSSDPHPIPSYYLILLAFLLLLLAAAVIALIFTLYMFVALVRDKVPYVATPHWTIDWLTDSLQLTTETVYDLGCGDGRVLKALKQKFPHIKAIGYERNWWPYVMAKIRNRSSGVEILNADFYQADLRDADVVFCYLIIAVMPRVEKLLRSQLKPGATVYSYGFTFPTWPPAERIVNPKKPQGSKINIYRA